MIDAAKLASANRITAVMPWFPYSRQDKKSAPREPITAKLVASCLEGAGADRVLTMDLHAGQIQGFFTIPVDHMTALPLFAQYYRDKGLWGDGVVAVAPDPGRGKMTTRFAQFLEADVAYMSKTRPDHDVAEVTEVVGRERVKGKAAILSDDLIVTGSTLISGAKALLEAGATAVYACATHALFPEFALEKIAESELTEIVRHRHGPARPDARCRRTSRSSRSRASSRTRSRTCSRASRSPRSSRARTSSSSRPRTSSSTRSQAGRPSPRCPSADEQLTA